MRACATRCVADAVELVRELVERLRVCPDAAAGATRTATSETVAMRLNMILLFDFCGWLIVPKTNAAARMTLKEFSVVV